MQGAPVRIGIVVIAATLACGAFLLYETSTACGCGSPPARELSLKPLPEGGLWVVAATPGLFYGDLVVMIDGAFLTLSGNLPPRFGEWSAFAENEHVAVPKDLVLAGHEIHLSEPGGETWFVDRVQNNIMARAGDERALG